MSTRVTRIVAHRGRRDVHEAENSLLAMRRAVAAGVTGLEVDLRTSRDGTIYLLHDETLDRTTTGTGPIARAGDDALAGVTLRSPDGGVTGEGLPRLDDLLGWVAGEPGIGLLLDIKAVDIRLLLAALVRHGVDDRSVILTFERRDALVALAGAHSALVSVWITGPADIGAYAESRGTHDIGLYLAEDAPASLFRAAAASGFPVVSDGVMDVPGGALDDRAETAGLVAYRDFLAERPVDFLVTDHAVKALRSLDPPRAR